MNGALALTAALVLSASIDDDDLLPEPGAARDAFLAAVKVARTDAAGAVAHFVEAAGQAPHCYAAWYNAGLSAELSSDLQTAEKHYRQALVVRPDYGPALANLTGVLDRTGREVEARRLIDDALKQLPDKAGPHLAAATFAWSRGDLTVAEHEALATLRYDDQSVPAMKLMATMFRAQGRLDTARFALENALQLEPGNALLHLELGHVHRALGADTAALVSFEKAARLRPTLVEAQDNYGVLLLKQGMDEEAVRALEQAARLDPRSARAQLHLGNALRATRLYRKAEAAYHKALELDPALAEVHFNLALLYIDNPLAGSEELLRLQKGLVELKAFKVTGHPNAGTAVRLDEYIDVTDKRIQREIKRRAREERRQNEDGGTSVDAPAPPARLPKSPATDGPAPRQRLG
jgi:tetratricopeptide (TPR) repeat protein